MGPRRPGNEEANDGVLEVGFRWHWTVSRRLHAGDAGAVADRVLEAARQGIAGQRALRQGLDPGDVQRHIVDYHRKEAPGTVVIDTDTSTFIWSRPNKKAIRYGVTVGEEAQGWSGVAKVGNMTEWPGWTPTAGEHQRLGPLPALVPGGPQNPMGARAIYLFANGKDTLFRIHGTNQPEYIGTAISSGCIRLTNEDVIDLYSRVKLGSPVVVLAPGHGDLPYSSQLALSQEFGHQTAQFNHQ